jgi:hypothetical protein
MPYATSTPNANEANTAHTNIKELIPISFAFFGSRNQA